MRPVFLSRFIRLAMLAAALVTVAACGGGGGGAGGESQVPAPLTANLAYVVAGSSAEAPPAGCRSVSDSGRVAHWSFDNAAGAKAFNTRFNSFHASLNSVSVVPGAIGQALRFDPSLSQSYAYISLNEGSLFANPVFRDARISVAMWIRPERLQAGASYQLFGGGALGPDSFHVRLVDGKVRLSLNASLSSAGEGNLIVQSNASVAVNTWQHVAVTFDGVKARVYLNGVQDTERDIAHVVLRAYNTLYIGGRPSGVGTFPGAIDELVLSNDLLGAAEVAGLANTATSTVVTRACGSAVAGPLTGPSGLTTGHEAHWSFDTITSAQVQNVRFNGLHANLVSVTPAVGAFGQGLRFDPALGSYGEILVSGPGTASLVFPDSRISIAMWLNPTQVQAGATYHLFGGGSFGSDSFKARIVDRKFAFALHSVNSASPGGEDAMLQSVTAIEAGRWQHVAVTSDGLVVRIYINGVLDAQKTISHPVGNVLNTLFIGGLPGGATFPGTIDELKLTNSTLSSTEIANLSR